VEHIDGIAAQAAVMERRTGRSQATTSKAAGGFSTKQSGCETALSAAAIVKISLLEYNSCANVCIVWQQ
jgi:hypothetical protein